MVKISNDKLAMLVIYQFSEFGFFAVAIMSVCIDLDFASGIWSAKMATNLVP